MMCDEGLIGISGTNSESIMVHTNSREAILGSNPLAFAMPAEPFAFWFDAATTVVPKGRMEVYSKKGLALPGGWAVDENGEVCTDAEHVLECIDGKLGAGGILPVGGESEKMGSHKGYGYSMICELLCAITVAEMKNMCEYLGMDSAEYLGEVDTSHAKAGTYDKVYK